MHYIAQKRTVAKNASEKDFFKLANNSVFGKTMENLQEKMQHRAGGEWTPADETSF